ncbi:MAG: rod shape-determining protein MreC [Opitutae bacterium]|nr:rod shape-determining protein MreC [Opitutae bacterium]
MLNQSDRRKNKPFFYLGIFALCWWGIPSSWKLMTKSGFREFQAPIWELSSRIEDLSNYWGHLSDSKQTLIEKGKELSYLEKDIKIQKERESILLSDINRLKSLKRSISNLNNLINIDSTQKYESIIARVSIRKMTGWWQQLSLRKGKDKSIQTGCGVIFDGGVVGRIKEVDSKSSEVEVITNPNFRIVAHFLNDNRPVTFQGNGIEFGGKPHGLVTDVPHDITPTNQEPLQLVTSHLGGTFPHGIHIGKVYKLEEGGNGLFKTGKVLLNEKLNEILEVTILKNLE